VEAVRSGHSVRRSVDRLVNFSDAVVAVAITVLVLPLVDIAAPEPGQSVWQMLGDHGGQVITFLFTFYVVAIMWQTHNRILNGIQRYDGALFWLNTSWLVLIVLLPWLSSMYGEAAGGDEGRAASGVGLLYWGALAVISLLGTAMSMHLGRHSDLLADPEADGTIVRNSSLKRGPAFAAYFIFIGVMYEFVPEVAAWLPLGIIVLSIWLRPTHQPDS
jgi:uncharacterized membrane protein